MTVTAKIINPRNAYKPSGALTRYDPPTNAYVKWVALTSVLVSFAEDEVGAVPIAGLQNFAMTESGVLGTYYAEIPTASTNLLIPYDGLIVYQIVTAGANSDLDIVTPLRVQIPRYAQ